MAYPLHIQFRVRSALVGLTSRDVTLERTVDLPFPPYPGISIVGGSGDGWATGPLEDLTYHCGSTTGRFEVILADDISVPRRAKAEGRPIAAPEVAAEVEALVAEYEARGWTRRTPKAEEV